MINIIVVTHSDVASHLIEAAERVVGKQSCLVGLNLRMEDSLNDLAAKISGAIGSCSPPAGETSKGILILTDLFGSTPTNASLAQIRDLDAPIEVVTGVNLPMMISALAYRNRMDLRALSEKVASDGQKGIRNARTVLMSRLTPK